MLTGSSSRTSLVSSEDEKADDSAGEDKPDALKADSDQDTPKFKSPLLQKLTAQKAQNVDSSTPKFKSPLLQSIMDKTKLGARLSQTKLNELGRSEENLSKSQSGDALEDSVKDKPDTTVDTEEPDFIVKSDVIQRADSYEKADSIEKIDSFDKFDRIEKSESFEKTDLEKADSFDKFDSIKIAESIEKAEDTEQAESETDKPDVDSEENNNEDTASLSPTDNGEPSPFRQVDPMTMSMFEPDLSNGTTESTDTIEQSECSDNKPSDRVVEPLIDSVAEVTVTAGPVIVDGPSPSVSERGFAGQVTDSQFTASSAADSAVSMTFNGVSSPQNGDVYILPKDITESRELVDSSISMRTADSFGSSQTGSMGGSLVESQNILTTSETNQFEDIIDLSVGNKTHFLNHSEDVLNLNSVVDNAGNGAHLDGAGDANSMPVKPFIAFEDNATRRQDVPDLLS